MHQSSHQVQVRIANMPIANASDTLVAQPLAHIFHQVVKDIQWNGHVVLVDIAIMLQCLGHPLPHLPQLIHLFRPFCNGAICNNAAFHGTFKKCFQFLLVMLAV